MRAKSKRKIAQAALGASRNIRKALEHEPCEACQSSDAPSERSEPADETFVTEERSGPEA